MKKFSIALGLFFSAFIVFGKNILSQDTTAINNFSTWLEIFLRMPIFSVGVFFIFKFLPKLNENFYLDITKFFSLRKFFLVSWLIIFLAWLPSLFAQYPGIYGYDSVAQIALYELDIIWLHFPPIHTWILGFCTATLGKFFGSYEIGFLIYTLLQIVAISFTCAAILTYMFSKKLSGIFIIAWQIFFMFFPLNPIMAMSATKDIFYSAFFALMMLMFCLMLEKNFTKKFFILLILISFAGIIFRSQGIYVFFFGILFGILLIKNLRTKLLQITFACFGLYLAYMFMLTNFLNILKDTNDTLREMSSIPIIQLSRVAVCRQPEDFDEIKKFIPNVENYANKISQGSSDSLKVTFKSDLVRENPAEFFNLWKKYLLKYPADYFDAFARLTVGLWYPPLEFEKYYSDQPYFQYESFNREGDWIIFIENPFENRTHKMLKMNETYQIDKRIISIDEINNALITIENKSLFGLNWLNEFYKNLAYNYSYEKIPVVKFLFSTGFIFWLTLIYIFYCLYKKNYRTLFPASFLIGLWLTMFAGPITLFRYTFPAALCIPILFTQIFANKIDR